MQENNSNSNPDIEPAPSTEHSLSNSQRRLQEALADVPEPFPTTRDLPVFERFGRHAAALRYGLDYLARREEREGDDQVNLHRNRAERNALSWLLREVLPGRQPEKPQPQNKRPDREYVRSRLKEAMNLMDEGYKVVKNEKPGVLFHSLGEDIAPVEVSLPVWFYVKGAVD